MTDKSKWGLYCPRCGHEQVCPCKNCKHLRKGIKPWIEFGNDTQKCANCGLEKHIDWWSQIEMDMMESE